MSKIDSQPPNAPPNLGHAPDSPGGMYDRYFAVEAPPSSTPDQDATVINRESGKPSPVLGECATVVNLESATSFLRLLDPSGVFTFQVIPEARDARFPTFQRVEHGTFEEHRRLLTIMNNRGAGIFVMVNAGDGVVRDGARTCRTTANVTRVRALFVDLDGAPIVPVLTSALSPDWVVQSSPGRWHAYWAVNDCPLPSFERAQDALAARFGGDPKVKDLPRVMRLPGFFHRKAEPYLSELYLPADYDHVLEQNHEC